MNIKELSSKKLFKEYQVLIPFAEVDDSINLKIKENYKLIPKIGVYIVKSILQEKTVFGIMNIGLNPTVNGEDLSIEVHFLDFDSDIYDTEITVSVIERIRDEQKFTSIDILKSQIQKDKNFAISYIEKIV